MSAPQFGPGDKIFAKVRGYPPWPARVEGVADETPNKVKYHVYFYGTGETAVCKQEELYRYLENREKFGKPMKKKGFNEALMQIDSELGLSPKVGAPQTPGGEDTEEEGSFIEGSGAKKNKSNTNTPITSKGKDKSSTSKRKSENVESDTSPKKPRKKSLPKELNSEIPQNAVSNETPAISRSGRKIKPKKLEELGDILVSPKVRAKNQKPNDSPDVKKVDVDAELLQDGILEAVTPKGEIIRIRLDFKRHSDFKSEKAKLEWEITIKDDCQKLKSDLESGKLLPEDVKKEINEKYKVKLSQIEVKMAHHDKKEKLDYLKTEAQLLDIDVKMKNSLSLKQADPETCLNLMDELMLLKLNPLMLKKHPEVVDTIKKLRRYVGNLNSWKMTDEEMIKFSNKAASIRSKAEHAYNKIKSLFMVPYGKAFWDIFANELKEFHECTKDLDRDEICELTKDPTEKSFKSDGALEESQVIKADSAET